MYLHNTNEAQILYYVWFTPIGGLHGLESTLCIASSLLPLLYLKNYITMKGHTTFLFTLPCFDSSKYPTLHTLHKTV
jgi:hypothetical protein